MFRALRRLLVVLLSLAGLSVAFAQAVPGREVTVELKSQKIVRLADGKEGRESAAQAAPGDVIEYVATYANRGKAAAKNFVATLPVPKDTDYIGASALPVNAQAATADGVFQAIPLKRTVKLANGQAEERDVPLSEYRTLRWQVGELGAGKEIATTLRVRLNSPPVAALSVSPASANSAASVPSVKK